jgi:hypothetical protein
MRAAYCRTCDSEDCRCDRPDGPIDITVKALRTLEERDLVESPENGRPPFTPSESLATEPPAPPTPPDLAHDQRILDRFKVAIRRCGVVGEETTAATVYLGITSRVTKKPASIAVRGTRRRGSRTRSRR